MSSRETTYAGMRDEWRQMLEAAKAAGEELAHLEGLLGRLETAWTQAHVIAQRQAALTAEKQSNSVELQKLMRDGERLATLMRKAVQQQYGPESEKVVHFRVQPFRGRKRKASPAEVKPEPEVQPTPEASTPKTSS